MAGERVEFVERLVELWNTGDYETWLDELGPDLEFMPDPSFPDAGAYRGEDLRRWMREWVRTWGENRFELLGIEETKDAVLIGGRWHLATRRGGGEVPLRDFTLVLLYPGAEADRPNRMAAYFDPGQAREVAAAGTG